MADGLPVNPLKVLGLQLATRNATTPADVAYNLQLASDAIADDGGKHDVYLLCEMFTVGYSDDVMAHLPALAEPIAPDAADAAAQGTSFRFMSAVAAKAGRYVVYGFPRRHPDGSITISQAVVDGRGALVGVYDKRHLCSYGTCSESDHFVRGDAAFTFTVADWTVGVAICYDLRFPEMWRDLAWGRGADVILHPSAFPRDGAFHSWEPFVVTRALENQVYVMSLSRAGANFGGSMVAPPWLTESDPELQLVRLGTQAASLSMTADPAVLARVRQQYSLRRDIHPSMGVAPPDVRGPYWSRNLLPSKVAVKGHTRRDPVSHRPVRAAVGSGDGSTWGSWLASAVSFVAVVGAAAGVTLVAAKRLGSGR